MRAGCDTFVGRVEALSLVQAQAKRVMADEPRMMLVVGDPGVGKTALLERSVAQLDGFQVLRGSGDESETDVPYALADQLFGDRASIRAGMPGEPFAVGAGLLDVLGGLQDSGAVAVVVDDAHWADVSSLKALLFALRRLRADRVLGLLAVRTEQEHRLPAGIGRQLEIGGGARVRLPGLPEAEVDQLLSSWEVGLPRRAVRRLWEHTGGNPLWLRALVDELPVEQLRAADLPLPAPVAFANGVQERLAGCSGGARDLVVAAAVAGGSSPLGELGRLAGLADPFAALDEAGRCGLLTSQGTPPTVLVSFPHPLVKAAVYDGLGAAPRAGWHRRAAALADDETVRIRHRVAACPGTDDGLSQEVAEHARSQRQSGAMDTAATALGTAARLAARDEDQEQLLLEAAQTWLMGAQVAEATDLLAGLPQRTQSPQRDLVDGWLALTNGEVDEAAHLLERACRDAPPDDGLLQSSACRMLANVYLLRGQGQHCATWAERAMRGAPSEWERHYAAGLRGMGLVIAGRTQDALDGLDWLPSDGEFGPTHLDAASCRGGILLWGDRLDDARADFQRLLSAAPRCGSFQQHVSALATLAQVEHRAGNWDDSIAHGARAVEHADDADQAWGLGPTHALASHTHARRGHWETAKRHVDEAARQSRIFPGNVSGTAYGADAAVLLAHSQRDWEALLVAAAPLLRMDGLDGANEPGIFGWRELYCEALLRLGRAEEASIALTPYEQVAAERGRRSAMGGAARVRGLLQADDGAMEAAGISFEAAVTHADAVGLPFDRALAQLAYGGVLRRSGRRRAAIERLTAATDTFVYLGAEPFVAQAEQELRGCGQTRNRRSQCGSAVSALTPQERSVAVLVGTGLSNREAASQLVVSVKTVEFHLTHIFAKLGLRSRGQLIRRIGEPGW